MLSLPDVTLVCVYNELHTLHELAIGECLRRARFGDVQIHTNLNGEFLGSASRYHRFFHYELPSLLRTSHALCIQWDSWIMNPEAWRDEFLDYDFVGAPWWYTDKYNVGNSGFCLRSKKLMQFIADNEKEFPVRHPEDHILCRVYQPRLPQFSWAPSELAWHFAFERTGLYPFDQVFGFHGLFNFPRVLDSQSLSDRLRIAKREPRITTTPEWNEVREFIPAE